jgi:hypothetical protein
VFCLCIVLGRSEDGWARKFTTPALRPRLVLMLVQASVLTTTTALSGAMLRWCCCLVIVGAPLTAAARPPITLMVTNGPRLMRQSSNSEEVEPVHRRPSPTKLMDGSSPGFSYSGGSLHWEDPIIYTWDEYLSEAECSAIIALATPGLHRANVSDDFGGSTSDGRTNDVSWLTHNQDPLVWDIVQRISSLVGLPSTHAENLQVIQCEVHLLTLPSNCLPAILKVARLQTRLAKNTRAIGTRTIMEPSMATPP